ncbi:site-specific integrase [Paraburkholderia sp. HP33-1]|uniref:site-specific integrase n=1 Tax=Paraburkholderia sp. HP33-1 TaxID=2883243 RepID=UPI001F1E997D|nr:site-specific integrase [Paraburkholderia sp. HP33-1]
MPKTESASNAVEPYVGYVPEFVTTRAGATFETRHDVWEVREAALRVRLAFNKLPQLSVPFKAAFQCALIWYARNSSLCHFHNMFQRARNLLDAKFAATGTLISKVTSVDILNYRSSLSHEDEYKLGAVSGFLIKWHELGLWGISDDAVGLLLEMRLTGNAKGVDVLTQDVAKGPFTNLELEALQQALNQAYGKKLVTEGEFALCWLFMALGQRAVQYSYLKACDVKEKVREDGVISYQLRIPRAKNRTDKPRIEFTERELTPQLGRHLARYAKRVKEAFVGRIENADEAPLFPSDAVGDAPAGFEFHQTSEEIAEAMVRVMSSLGVISERTGDYAKIGAKRFRHTIGTRAAQEGHSERVIAALLDHIDTQHVGVYVKATPAIVKRIDKAMAMTMAPYAQAFAGKLIAGPSYATRAFDPASDIRAPQMLASFDGMSSCGKYGFCGFSKPIACYTCESFEPWLDGPHELVLDFMLSDRERKMKTCDPRIASINDRTIFAIAEVIQLCAAVRAESDVAGSGDATIGFDFTDANDSSKDPEDADD